MVPPLRNFKRTLCQIVPNLNIEVISFLEKLRNYLILLVPEAGLEPARYFYQRILSPQRLPIPPPGRDEEKRLKLTQRHAALYPATNRDKPAFR